MEISVSRRPLWLTCCSSTCTALKTRCEGLWTRLLKRWEWRKLSLSSTPHGQVHFVLTTLLHKCECFSSCHLEFMTYCCALILSRYAVPVRASPPHTSASVAHGRGADRDLRRQPGPAAESHVIQVHCPLFGRSVVVAEQAFRSGLCHFHLVRGAADMDPPGKHLHWLWGHPLTAARGNTLNR